jgi:hypothetical protein
MSSFILRPQMSLLYQTQMIDEYEASGGMLIDKEKPEFWPENQSQRHFSTTNIT